jgi:hypothetical protein
MIDYRAMKRDWKQNAEREMNRRADWWEEHGNRRMAEEYRSAIQEMKTLEKKGVLVDDQYES